ncbi:MAG TPA: coenzyme F420-0:L-glutamate ligase [Nitrososphaerales archaeon]|nr:coenzyme F420-0:L-glutamate ligase [Nitrososphaerales archaeon]
MNKLEIFPVKGFPEVTEGADIGSLLLAAARSSRLELRDGDAIVIKQKIVSKAEGRLVLLRRVKPSAKAKKLAGEQGKDPRLVELILREAVRVVRAGHGVIITETRHGLVCANSGVDRSNVSEGYAALLPVDPDASARRIRKGIEAVTGKKVAVIVSDTFGRPWRKGQTDVAIGCSGIDPLFSYRGKVDRYGYELRVTEPAVADELAGAAELATGKLSRIPAAVVRGATFTRREVAIRSIAIEKEKDLFR